jgi:hypothetical protein
VVILEKYISFLRELGRVPLTAELRIKARSDTSFPSHGLFAKLGGKQALIAGVREHREAHNISDVITMLPAQAGALPEPHATENEPKVPTGYVYLMKSGRHFKIGRTNSVGRRGRELGIKIPIPPSTLHVMKPTIQLV